VSTRPEAPTTTDAILARHDRAVRRRIACVALIGTAALAMFCLDVGTGSSSLSLGQVFDGLLHPARLSRPMAVIIFDVRLAYAVMAVLVGAALALAGAEMQTILDNPLASPFTLGVSAAAALGAAVGIVLNAGIPALPQAWVVPGNAFLFALGAIAAVQALARLRGGSTEILVLLGITMMFAANAGTALLQFVASAQTLQQLVFWTLGGLGRTDWTRIAVMAGTLGLALPLALAAAPGLNALRFGEDRARTFGVDVRRLRTLALLRVGLLTAVAVAFVGTIPFVGLVAPHMARLVVGEDHRLSLPASVLGGALLMSAASVASKLVVPGVIVPLGVVTSLVGVPVLLALILTRGGRRA
jgi:iron complex transport system permease protein